MSKVRVSYTDVIQLPVLLYATIEAAKSSNSNSAPGTVG